MKNEAIAIAAEHKGNVQNFSVAEGLLHTCADGVRVVLCLDDSDGNVRFVVENVVGELPLSPSVHVALHVNPPIREIDLFSYLGLQVPSGIDQGWRDILRADVAFAEVFFGCLDHFFFRFWDYWPGTDQGLKTSCIGDDCLNIRDAAPRPLRDAHFAISNFERGGEPIAVFFYASFVFLIPTNIRRYRGKEEHVDKPEAARDVNGCRHAG